MKKRRKKGVPVMLFWSKREQARFIENVERFSGLVNDLERILAPVKRKRATKQAPATSSTTSPAAATSEAKGGAS